MRDMTLGERLRYSASCSERVASIPKSFPIAPGRPFKPLSEAKLSKVEPDSVIHSDSWRCYNGLVDLGYKKHYRVHHGNDQFVNGKRHINGIESFWSFAKRRLMKSHGIPQATFYLHLKEGEFRFNYRNQNNLPSASKDPERKTSQLV